MRGRAAPEHSLLKLYGSETLQRLLLAGGEAQGVAMLDEENYGPRMWRQGSCPADYPQPSSRQRFSRSLKAPVTPSSWRCFRKLKSSPSHFRFVNSG